MLEREEMLRLLAWFNSKMDETDDLAEIHKIGYEFYEIIEFYFSGDIEKYIK